MSNVAFEQEGELARLDGDRAVAREHGGRQTEAAGVQALVEDHQARAVVEEELAARAVAVDEEDDGAAQGVEAESCSRAKATSTSKERRKSTGSRAA